MIRPGIINSEVFRARSVVITQDCEDRGGHRASRVLYLEGAAAPQLLRVAIILKCRPGIAEKLQPWCL